MDTFTVTLPAELKPFVDAQVASGEYASVDEFVRTLVEDALSKEDVDRIETLIQEGLESETEEVTPQTWIKLREDLQKRMARKQGTSK